MTEEEKKKKEEEEKAALEAPKPDYTKSKKLEKSSKTCGLITTVMESMPFFIIPLGIGFCAGGLAILGSLVLLGVIFGFLTGKICDSLKGDFEKAAKKQKAKEEEAYQKELEKYKEKVAEREAAKSTEAETLKEISPRFPTESTERTSTPVKTTSKVIEAEPTL